MNKVYKIRADIIQALKPQKCKEYTFLKSLLFGHSLPYSPHKHNFLLKATTGEEKAAAILERSPFPLKSV